MSAKVMAAVLDYPFQHTAKAVMLALANQCNDFGMHCFPSFDLIQRHTSLGRRTVFAVLRELEESGFVTRVEIRNSQRVEFRIHVAKLQQLELPELMPDEGVNKDELMRKHTGAGNAPVHEAHRCMRRTGANYDKTGAGDAPTSAGDALYKAPVNLPKSTHLALGAREAAIKIRKGLIAGGYPAHRIPATDPRIEAAAADGVTGELAESVSREAAGHDPPKSFGWIMATCRGRIADAKNQSPRGTQHATRRTSHSEPRASAVDRVFANIERAQAADAAGGFIVDADHDTG